MVKLNRYKYLRLVFDYKLDLSVTAQSITKSVNRALGLLISKVKACGGLSYTCFTKLYESMVVSVIRYRTAVWGYKEYSCIDAVHNHMCRYFLSINKVAAVQGYVGVKVP